MGGSSVINSSILTAVTDGISSLTALVTEVYTIVIPACVGVILIGAGSMFLLRKIRGLLSWA
jgi:hypothetical protein